MNVSKAAIAGAVGALTTNALHEINRRIAPDAPRVDLLGMQALASALTHSDVRPPRGRTLYALTLTGDLLSNSAYFGMVGAFGPGAALPAGAALGLAAGIGAAYLPAPLGLDERPTGRTPQTRAMTVALYFAGGVAAALTYRALSA